MTESNRYAFGDLVRITNTKNGAPAECLGQVGRITHIEGDVAGFSYRVRFDERIEDSFGWWFTAAEFEPAVLLGKAAFDAHRKIVLTEYPGLIANWDDLPELQKTAWEAAALAGAHAFIKEAALLAAVKGAKT